MKKLKHPKRAVCSVCKSRRILGRCNFGFGKASIGEHCRGCCSAPARDRWRPVKVAGRARATA